jgi:uncharacterized protein YqfB (UPF0267 family)
MKNSLILIALVALLLGTACTKQQFADNYSDPTKTANTDVPKQFLGVLHTSKDYVLPAYWNYFVFYRTTLTRYTQAVGWVNEDNQYIPAAAGVSDRWSNYYQTLGQYRALQKINEELPAEVKSNLRIFMIAATIFIYDLTIRTVDLHGDIPFTEAGMIHVKGNYSDSYAKYDDAQTIYVTILDQLKLLADELNTIVISDAVEGSFKSNDVINQGSIELWKKYCNSLRIKLLSRVSGVAALQARANTEIASILAGTTYPISLVDEDNIAMDVINPDGDFHSRDFRTGLEDWGGNIAGKAIIDNMVTNSDPRLRVVFEPGSNANGVYRGIDQMATNPISQQLIDSSWVSIYNRSTLSRNQLFPGMLISAAEVNFFIAEFYMKAGNMASAKTHYENGIRESIRFYYNVRGISNNTESPALVPLGASEISDYFARPNVSWDAATNDAQRIARIATQKWLHLNVVNPIENWNEYRRLDAPNLIIKEDGASSQRFLPLRLNIPSAEATFNPANYQAVQSKDNLTTKIFWDVN